MKLQDLHEQNYEELERKVKNVIKVIDEKCKPFLSQINSHNDLLYRGMNKSINGYTIIQTPKNRQPVDTPLEIHKALDEWFLKKFGHRYRSNAAFVTPRFTEAKSYGNPYAFFPIGDFDFVWSNKFGDLYAEIQHIVKQKLGASVQNAVKEDPEETKEIVLQLVKNGDYTDKNLVDAIRAKNEIMVDCDKYILVDPRVYDTQLFELHFKDLLKHK